MLGALLAIPVVLAGVAFASPWRRVRAWTVTAGGVAHLLLTFAVVAHHNGETGAWLAVDHLSALVLLLVSIVFCAVAVYTPGYLAEHPERPDRVFCGSLLIFLAASTLIALSRHLGLLWVALEASTLAIAPLVYFDRNARSLEATWKYLLLGSVGIALALLGSFFLAYSALHEGLLSSLLFDDLIRMAPRLSRPWLHSAFVLLFIGYGTKMGVAPMHSWKPDAYGEAPGLAGTLLAGVSTSSAFLAILRFYQVMAAAGEGLFARHLMIAFGLVSMTVAATFMIRQRDLKRSLAYSSVEHMGILLLGVGIGGAGAFGALLHMLNNGLTKGVLFLSAGNIHRAYHSKHLDDVRGALHRLPVTAPLFLAGFFAITGSPPFGPFLSEFTILQAAFGAGRVVTATVILLMLVVVFFGMASTVLAVVQGRPSEGAAQSEYRENAFTVGPIIALLGLVLMLGLYIPPSLGRLLHEAARLLEVGA